MHGKPRPPVTIGQTYGRWIVIGGPERRVYNARGFATPFWLCRCDCGTERWVIGNNLNRGGSLSCGCPEVTDELGKRHGRWTVIGGPERRLTKEGWAEIWWFCRCDCGTEQWRKIEHLISGRAQSCGCLRRDVVRVVNRTHGAKSVHNPGVGARIYSIWRNMLERCESPQNPAYVNYGGRGISVCQEWHDFVPFRDWALGTGYRDDLSIDRIDNDGNYEPGNCRFADRVTQRNNSRQKCFVTAWGETKTFIEWTRDERCKASYQQAKDRIGKLGWPAEEALSTPTIPQSARRFGSRLQRT